MKDFKEYILSEATFTHLINNKNYTGARNKAEKLLKNASGNFKKRLEDFIETLNKLPKVSVVSEGAEGAADTASAAENEYKTPHQTISRDSNGNFFDKVILDKLKTQAKNLDQREFENSEKSPEDLSLDEIYKNELTSEEQNSLRSAYRNFFRSLSDFAFDSEAIENLAISASKDGNDKILSELELKDLKFNSAPNTSNKKNWSFIIAVLWLKTASRTLYTEMFNGSGEIAKAAEFGFSENQKRLFAVVKKRLSKIVLGKDIMSKLPPLHKVSDLSRSNAEKIKNYVESLQKPNEKEHAELVKIAQKARKSEIPQNPQNTSGLPDSKNNENSGNDKSPGDNENSQSLADTKDTAEPETVKASGSSESSSAPSPDDQNFVVGYLTFRNSLKDIEKAILHSFGSADGKEQGGILRTAIAAADMKRDENDKEYKNSKIKFESYNPVSSAIEKNKILSERFAIRGRLNTSREHTEASWNSYKKEMANTQIKYRNTADKIIARWDDQLSSTPERKKIIDRLKELVTEYRRKLNKIVLNAEKKNSYNEIGKTLHDIRDITSSAGKFLNDKRKDSAAGRAAAYDRQQVADAVNKVDISALQAAAEKNPQNFKTFAYAVKNPGYLESPDTTTGDPKANVTIGTIAGNVVTSLGFQSDKNSVAEFIKAFNQKYISKENMSSDITKLIMDKSAEYEKSKTVSVMIDDLQRIQKLAGGAIQKLQELNKQGKGITSEQALLAFIKNPAADLSKLPVSEMSFGVYYNTLYEWKNAVQRAEANMAKSREKLKTAQEDAAKKAAQKADDTRRKNAVNWYKQNNKNWEASQGKIGDNEMLALATMLLIASKNDSVKREAASILQIREKDGKSPEDYLQASAAYSQEHPDIVANMQKALSGVFTIQAAQQPQTNSPAAPQAAQAQTESPAGQAPQQSAEQPPQSAENPQRKLGEVPVSAQTSVTTAAAGSYNIPDRLYKKMIRRKLGF